MVRGEYESQQALAQHIPENVVTPLAYGTFELDPTKSFFLAVIREFQPTTPDPTQLAKVLETLHRRSTSPTGKYEFHTQTFNGVVPINNDWCNTWEEWFSRQLRSDILWERNVAGPDPEFDKIVDAFFSTVIPRLLRPLETGGRTIRPTPVHGDLWHGNCQVDASMQQVVLFDSCCCYGHNEMELHMMRDSRYGFSEKHIQAYRDVVEASEPVEDFDDRNALYAIRDNIINSGLHQDRRYLRQKVKEEMQRIIAKHPNGLDGFIELAKR